jgi:DNA excision repair protein ERCC-2
MLDSYMYMENVINHWDQMGVLQKCMEHKLVYLETKDVVETTLALDNYKKACDSGRGAVFLSIARGKVAEGIDFDNHYGRCVVLFGIPYQYTKSHVLRARLDFMREKYQVTRDLCSAATDLTFPLSPVMRSLLRSCASILHAP